jgi:phage terminase small subunit
MSKANGMHRGLTPKQAAFVREYLVDKNATQAAIRAGYSVKTAASIGEENLRKPEIRTAIDVGLADLATRVGITAEMVLRERKRIAFFDPRKLLDSEGNPKPIQDLDDDTAAAIAGLDVVQMSGGEAIPGVISLVKKYKLAAKDTSLAALEKYLGLNEKPMRFALPKIESPEDCTRAQGAVLNALARGDLLPMHAQALSSLIDAQRRTFETSELAKRLEALEAEFSKRGGALR